MHVPRLAILGGLFYIILTDDIELLNLSPFHFKTLQLTGQVKILGSIFIK